MRAGLRVFLGILAFVAFVFAIFWSRLPSADKASYFNFADQRIIWGINNFFDVMSNAAFALVGLCGHMWVKFNKSLTTEFKIIGYTMAISIFLVALGSGYFHLIPNEERLFWDRAPMVVAFISVAALLVTDRLNPKLGLFTLILFSVIGLISLYLWHIQVFDLRPYLITQFGGLLFILILSTIKPKGNFSNQLIALSMISYITAKIFETYDHEIFNLLNTQLSGHTLKHLAAALAMHFLLLGFKRLKV